jgi:glycosyltransferase involved in cell wall biosynthesis
LRESFGPPILATGKERDRSSSKVKVLVCHVFFPPQSYGGATRVVQDNVDYIEDECPDIELAVFTTDEGISLPGRFRFDQYKGIPVFRLSTPIEPNMDWRPFNTEHEDVFERVLDAVQPDLIHFHCIQRLTASIVEIAFRRKIPYLVTVHDGWWISDHQFFVDQDDILRLPSPDCFADAPPPDIPLLASIARRQRLAGLLDGAAKVLAVSDAFAEIYRRAGCRNVMAIPNGVSPIIPAPRRRNRDDGRLSLGHVGGRSAHKGATLVEAVLRMTHFDHLKLTMIDFRMEPGTRSERIWGNTPVLLCGAYPQDQVAALYASLDVLLAPSIWPESFGLVAREAQAQGLWVIASDRGAVAEGIRNGDNGFVIDVSDGRALTEVLQKLDADIVRYKTRPPGAAEPMRTAADQGAELAELYRRAAEEHAGTKLFSSS